MSEIITKKISFEDWSENKNIQDARFLKLDSLSDTELSVLTRFIKSKSELAQMKYFVYLMDHSKEFSIPKIKNWCKENFAVILRGIKSLILIHNFSTQKMRIHHINLIIKKINKNYNKI